MRIFVTAAEARKFGAKNVRAIHEEVRHIETRVLDAVDAGRLDTTVLDSPFGVGSIYVLPPADYWRVWKYEKEDRVVRLHLDSVNQYFQNLGFEIHAKTNPNTLNSLCWVLAW